MSILSLVQELNAMLKQRILELATKSLGVKSRWKSCCHRRTNGNHAPIVISSNRLDARQKLVQPSRNCFGSTLSKNGS
jgi:hypothetical protein